MSERSIISRAGEPLLVVATPEEAEHLPKNYPLLVTGIGKLNAAVSLAEELYQARAEGIVPSVIINIGTAGSLGAPAGIHRIREVRVHDFSVTSVGEEAGDNSYPVITLPDVSGTGMRLATGDCFIESAEDAARIAEVADLVDMEGYAVAMAAQRAGVPVELIKIVSDSADDNAGTTWHEVVEECSRLLGQWLLQNESTPSRPQEFRE